MFEIKNHRKIIIFIFVSLFIVVKTFSQENEYKGFMNINIGTEYTDVINKLNDANIPYSEKSNMIIITEYGNMAELKYCVEFTIDNISKKIVKILYSFEWGYLSEYNQDWIDLCNFFVTKYNLSLYNIGSLNSFYISNDKKLLFEFSQEFEEREIAVYEKKSNLEFINKFGL